MDAPCPNCGQETGGYGPRSLCRECYLEEEELLEVPEEIEVERCKHCGRVHLGMDWVEALEDQDFIYHVLQNEVDNDRVKAVSFREDEDGYIARLLVRKRVDGEMLQQEVETRITVESTQCTTCSRFEVGYYEYKIQLRGEHLDNALEEMLERAAEMTDRNRDNFVSSVEEEAGGYDVYLSSRDMAEALLRVVREGYDMEEKRSKELIGEEEGQKVYRSVVSARVK